LEQGNDRLGLGGDLGKRIVGREHARHVHAQQAHAADFYRRAS